MYSISDSGVPWNFPSLTQIYPLKLTDSIGNSENLANKHGASGSRMHKYLNWNSLQRCRVNVHSENLPANGRRIHSKITSDCFDAITVTRPYDTVGLADWSISSIYLRYTVSYLGITAASFKFLHMCEPKAPRLFCKIPWISCTVYASFPPQWHQVVHLLTVFSRY